MVEFKPSAYQAALFEEISTGQGNVSVNAVAGSGKTTTLVQGSKLTKSDNALFLAFNKSIVGELSSRLAGAMQCRTNHSLGMGAVRSALVRGRKKLKVRPNKYRDIIDSHKDDIVATVERGLTADGMSQAEKAKVAFKAPYTLKSLVALSQLTLTGSKDLEGLLSIYYHYGLDSDFEYPSLLLSWVDKILFEGELLAKHSLEIDFNDMLWLPCIWELIPDQYEWLFVDECQDLSAAQLSLIQQSLKRGGRAIFVGDKRQAIYGFAGADNQSFSKIITTMNSKELPLSICYRCPKKVIGLAQAIVPEIEPSEWAIEGVVDTIKLEKLPSQLKCGDLILCRTTAPLIKLCIQLIAKRIPASVKGRDIGKLLTSIVEEIATIPGFCYQEFPKFLDDYFQAKLARLASLKNPESAIQSLEDRVEGLLACYEGFSDCSDITCLAKEITDLFSDESSSIQLATVHRTKGLESNRVFILKPEKLPLTWKNQLSWQYEQEMNLRYVALTRAKQELYFVVD